VLNAIIDKIREQNNGTARFVKRDSKTGSYFEISDDAAREKVGHTIRESIAAMDKVPLQEKTKKVFETKQGDLLSEQRSIFEKMVSTPPQSPMMFGASAASTRTIVTETTPSSHIDVLDWRDGFDLDTFTSV